MKPLINKAKIFAIKILVKTCGFISKQHTSDDANKGRYLIVSTTGIGDTLWGTPAIKALKKKYPDSYLGVLTNPLGLDMLSENPDIDKLFVYNRGAHGLPSLPSLITALRQDNFDTVFIFHASDRVVWIISFLTNASEILGIKGQNKGLDFILTQAISPDSDIHEIDTRFELINKVGVTAPSNTLSLYLNDKDRKNADIFLQDHNINSESLLVGLHPGAQKPFKCWPEQNFIELGNALTEMYGCRVIVTGNADEKMLTDRVASGIKGAVSSAGILSLRDTAAVIDKMNLFITNDTGPMHIAFALGTPTAALFCPTNPEQCGPYNTENAIVLQKPATCDPCIGKKCNNAICMEQITVEEVITATNSIIDVT